MKPWEDPEIRGAYDIEWCYECEKPKEDCDHFRPKMTGVHNSGGDVCDPALPESPFPAGCAASPERASRESIRGDRSASSDESLAIDGHSRGGGNAGGNTPATLYDDIGGNVIPDRIQANKAWFSDDEHPMSGADHPDDEVDENAFGEPPDEHGAESNAYTAGEAEARRKEANE